MSDTARPPHRDVRHEPMRDPQRRGTTRWLLIGCVAVLVFLLLMWLTTAPDMEERTEAASSTDLPAERVIADQDPDSVGFEGNDVEAVTETAPVPVEDADPNAVPPQDGLIPPAPEE